MKLRFRYSYDNIRQISAQHLAIGSIRDVTSNQVWNLAEEFLLEPMVRNVLRRVRESNREQDET